MRKTQKLLTADPPLHFKLSVFQKCAFFMCMKGFVFAGILQAASSVQGQSNYEPMTSIQGLCLLVQLVLLQILKQLN